MKNNKKALKEVLGYFSYLNYGHSGPQIRLALARVQSEFELACFELSEATTLEATTKSQFKIDSLYSIVSWFEKRQSANIGEESVEFKDVFIQYIEFRKNQLFKNILQNPTTMRGTCMESNLKEMYNNIARTELLSNIFLPLSDALNGGSADPSCALENVFPTL